MFAGFQSCSFYHLKHIVVSMLGFCVTLFFNCISSSVFYEFNVRHIDMFFVELLVFTFTLYICDICFDMFMKNY